MRVTLISLLLAFALETATARNIGAVVVVNSRSPGYHDFAEFVQPYLDHFDIPYRVSDIAERPLVEAHAGAAVLIAGHRQLSLDDELRAALHRSMADGTGLVSFDPHAWPECTPQPAAGKDSIRIAPAAHYITARKLSSEAIPPLGEFRFDACSPDAPGLRTLATLNGVPLLSAGEKGRGRVVIWSSYSWLDPKHLGFFAGIDDLVWRSIVWAARKPFVMQGMPPLVGMRVDDCAGGRNGDWAYVEAANRIGLVPHCSFMLDQITDASARKMAELVKAGKMEVSIHARSTSVESQGFFWWDHPNNRPFDDRTMEQNYRDSERFLRRYGIRHASTLNTHYEEMGRNAIPYLRKLGVEFIASWTNFGLPAHRQDEVRAAPYLRFRPAGYWAVAPSSASSGHFVYRPRAVMDFLDPERRFFDSYVDPIDIKYDWLRRCELAPYKGSFADEGMILDGLAMLRRELDSMFPAYYFTHEVNINRYNPGHFARLVAGVWSKLAPYRPEAVSYDGLNRYARAQFTARLSRAEYDDARREMTIVLSGSADVETRFWVFENGLDGILERMERAPRFKGSTTVRVSTKGPVRYMRTKSRGAGRGRPKREVKCRDGGVC